MKCKECLEPLPEDATERRKFCNARCRKRFSRRKPDDPLDTLISQTYTNIRAISWYEATLPPDQAQIARDALRNILISLDDMESLA